MKERIIICFLSAVLLVVGGCTYPGMLTRPDNIQPVKAKYDLKAAIVVNPELKQKDVEINLDAPGVWSNIPYKYNDLITFYAPMMGKLFSRVQLVDENALDKNSYDILLYPEISILQQVMTKPKLIQSNVKWLGKDHFGNKIFETSNTWKYKIPYGSGSDVLAMIPPFYFLAPVFSKINADNFMLEFNKDFNKTADDVITSIGNNSFLRRYATGVKEDPVIQVARVDRADDHTVNKNNLPIKTSIKSDIDRVPESRKKPNGKAYAIVIGIEQYRQKLQSADYAINDATSMAEYLTKLMGYPEENVITLLNENASKSDLEKYFEKWLSNSVEDGSTLFVYFSGHGAPNIKGGDAYLVPYDGDPTYIAQTGYSVKRLYSALGKLKANNIIVVLDSCFSGAGGRSVIARGTRPIILQNDDLFAVTKNNLTILTATSENQISSTYEDKGHGLFTYFFLKGIKDAAVNNESIDIGELYDYVKPQVQRISRKMYNNEQTPMFVSPNPALKKQKIF